MNKKKAFIIGVSGQDGSYMSKFLIDKKYSVIGYTRSKKKKNLQNLYQLKIKNKINIKNYSEEYPKIILEDILKFKPNEIYFFSGQSSVSNSFKIPLETYISNINILFEILELLRSKSLKKVKLFNSTSTDCFGNNNVIYNKEKNIFSPISPYAKAKNFSFWIVRYYREQYKIHAKNGILSNHESPLRPSNFVIKKIVDYVNNPKKKFLQLGNINVYRDWGWAPEFIQAIHKINTAKIPDDYVVGTGKLTSLKSLVVKIFKSKKIDLKFLKHNNSKSLRNIDIKKIGTNPSKIFKKLKWKSKVNINQIVKKMLHNELY